MIFYYPIHNFFDNPDLTGYLYLLSFVRHQQHFYHKLESLIYELLVEFHMVFLNLDQNHHQKSYL